MFKKFSSSGQNDVTLWGRFSKGDTLLDYCFHLFQGNDVVLTLVTPDIGRDGVEGDDRTPPEQATRVMATNRGKRKRMDDQGAIASLAASSTVLTQAITKQAAFGELATLSETLKNLREADADPRFISAVEQKLERILFPPSVPAAPGTDASGAGSSRAESEYEGVGGSVGREDEGETFM